MVQHHLRYTGQKRLRLEFEDLRADLLDAADDRIDDGRLLFQLRRTTVLLNLANSVWHDRSIVGFDRNSTVHDAHLGAVTPVNALRGLMTATATLRELQFELADEWLRTP